MKDKYLRDRRQHRWHLQSFVKQLQFAFFKYWAKGLVCIPAAAWQAAGNSHLIEKYTQRADQKNSHLPCLVKNGYSSLSPCKPHISGGTCQMCAQLVLHKVWERPTEQRSTLQRRSTVRKDQARSHLCFRAGISVGSGSRISQAKLTSSVSRSSAQMGSICSLNLATSVLASFLGIADSSSSTSVSQNVQRKVPETREVAQRCKESSRPSSSCSLPNSSASLFPMPDAKEFFSPENPFPHMAYLVIIQADNKASILIPSSDTQLGTVSRSEKPRWAAIPLLRHLLISLPPCGTF